MNTITDGNYVDQAESIIQKLKKQTNQRTGKQIPMVTTSKIRNLLAITDDIYNDVLNCSDEVLPESITSRIEYLRVRFVYETGRDPRVEDLVKGAKILDVLKEIKGSRKNYILFTRYMEALVAFHKFYGGKDN